MAVEWSDRPLGQLITSFDELRVPVKEADRKPGPYPYYGASGIVDYTDSYRFDGEYLLVAEDGENLRTRKTPVAFMARGKFWVNNHAHVVRANDHADTRFLMYALSVADIGAYLTGSTMPKLTQGNLHRIPLRVPPRGVQTQIADILGALDDKIDLNRRMSETLEAMARALFTSWFVDFDPVEAKAEGRDMGLPKEIADQFPDSFEDSELGEIPKGWTVGRVAEEFNLVMGQSPPGATLNQEGLGLAFFQGSTDFGLRFPTNRVYCQSPTRLAQEDDTLVSVRAPVGALNVAMTDCAIGRGVAAIRHTSGATGYTYQCMRALTPAFAVFNGEGTVFGSIGKTDFQSIRVIRPPDAVIAAYQSFSTPIDDRLRELEKESRTLVELRDALLPRLLSGEVVIPARLGVNKGREQ